MRFLKIKSLVINLDKVRRWEVIPKAEFWPPPNAPAPPPQPPAHPAAATQFYEPADEFVVVIDIDGERHPIKLAPAIAKAFVAHMANTGQVEEIEI